MRRLQQAESRGGPSLSELKRIAGAMILKAPELTDREIELAEIGRRLFFDPRLSDSHINCAHCHQPDLFFTDGLPLAIAIDQSDRNTPTVVNSFALFWFFWDGRADSLAAQALGPMENSREHGFSRAGVARVMAQFYKSDYERLFGPLPRELPADLPTFAMPLALEVNLSESVLAAGASSLTDPVMIRKIAAHGDPVAELKGHLRGEAPASNALKAAAAWSSLSTREQDAVNTVFANAGLAIAAYERGLLANTSPFDRFISAWTQAPALDPVQHFDGAFGPEEFFGFQIFAGKGQCNFCHTGAALTDNQFHNIGLPQRGDKIELGRSVGLVKVLNDPFNCKGSYLPQGEAMTESCRDLDYLNIETPEALGSFKTPALRSVARTAPYMHDGRFAELEQVIDHYNRMDTMAAVGFREETLRPLGLDEIEKKALLSFLRSLTSPVQDLSAGQNLPSQ